MKDKTATTCKGCNRVVYTSDVDDKGKCVDCKDTKTDGGKNGK